jgi:1-deoxy-D-xylulose-5-phosphate synthase
VGIAEEHAMTFASGLAKGGVKPYFAVYSSFLQRAYDQIIHDTAIAGLPVRILVDRAGVVGEDGKTHHGLFDLAFLSSVPGMTVYSPASFDELEKTILNTTDVSSPVAIRYPRGCEEQNGMFPYTGNDFDLFFEGNKTAIVSFGRLSFNAYKAAKEKEVTFIKLNRVYPVADNLIPLLMKFDKICIFEEGIRSGGIGEKIMASLSEQGFKGKVSINAVNNEFVKCASSTSQLRSLGLDENAMIGVIS